MPNDLQLTQNTLDDFLSNPCAMDVFPSSDVYTIMEHEIPGYEARKAIERLLTLSCFKADLESLRLLSTGIKLDILERYEDKLAAKQSSVSPHDILYSDAKFPNTLLPLNGIFMAYLDHRIDIDEIDDYMEPLVKMGLAEYTQDKRYMAAMLRKLYQSREPLPSNQDQFSKLLGKFSEYGLFIEPCLVSPKIDLPSIYMRNSDKPGTENMAEYVQRHGYVNAMFNHLASGAKTILKPSDFSRDVIIDGFVSAVVLDSSRYDDLAEKIFKTFDFKSIFDSLEENNVTIKQPGVYVSQPYDRQEFNAFSLLSMMIQSSYGRSMNSRQILVKGMLDAGLAEKLSTVDGTLRFLRQLNGATPFPDLYENVLPHLNIEGALKVIQPHQLTRMALQGNRFAIFHLGDKSLEPRSEGFFRKAYTKLTADEQLAVLDKKLPGFSTDLRRISKHNEVKRVALSDDLGL